MGEIYDPGGFVVTQARQEGVDSPVGKLLETKGSQMIPKFENCLVCMIIQLN